VDSRPNVQTFRVSCECRIFPLIFFFFFVWSVPCGSRCFQNFPSWRHWSQKYILSTSYSRTWGLHSFAFSFHTFSIHKAYIFPSAQLETNHNFRFTLDLIQTITPLFAIRNICPFFLKFFAHFMWRFLNQFH
jgi:hypothetical protein